MLLSFFLYNFSSQSALFWYNRLNFIEMENTLKFVSCLLYIKQGVCSSSCMSDTLTFVCFISQVSSEQWQNRVKQMGKFRHLRTAVLSQQYWLWQIPDGWRTLNSWQRKGLFLHKHSVANLVDFGFLGSGYFYRWLIPLRKNGRIAKQNTFLYRVLIVRTLVA
jgi:hypothetical protein